MLVYDEPEVGLHPQLVGRVVSLFEHAAAEGGYPVFVCTQSDALLDALSDPAGTTRICELGADGGTELSRLDEEALAKWMADYRGVGSLRVRGELEQALVPDASPSGSGFAAIDAMDPGTAAQ